MSTTTSYRVEYGDEQGNSATHNYTLDQLYGASQMFHILGRLEFAGFIADDEMDILENDRVLFHSGYDAEVGNFTVVFVAVNANAPTRTLIVAGKSGPAFPVATAEVPQIGVIAQLSTDHPRMNWSIIDRGEFMALIFGMAAIDDRHIGEAYSEPDRMGY